MKFRVFLAFFAIHFGVQSAATTVLQESSESIARRAPVVVYGKVVQIDVDSQSGFRTAIVESIETARAPQEFQNLRDFYIPLLNRSIPNRDEVEVVFSAPELHLLEEVVLFLAPIDPAKEGYFRRTDAKQLFTLEGFYQGKMKVAEDLYGVRHALAWNEVVESSMTAIDLKKQKTTPRLKVHSKSAPVGVLDPKSLSHSMTLDSILNISRAPRVGR